MKEVDLGLTRSRSLNLRNRPVSVNLGAGPNAYQGSRNQAFRLRIEFLSVPSQKKLTLQLSTLK